MGVLVAGSDKWPWPHDMRKCDAREGEWNDFGGLEGSN